MRPTNGITELTEEEKAVKDILEENMKSNIQERMEGLRLKICSCCTKVMVEGLQADMVHLQRQVACNFGLERESRCC